MKRGNDIVKSWRCGWYRMWDFAPELLRRWGVPRPGAWPKDNVFKGALWCFPQEWRKVGLSGERLARVLERAWEKKATVSTLAEIQKACSFMYLTKTGTASSNFEEVHSMWKSLDFNLCKETTSCKPTRIISPQQQKAAYDRQWQPTDDVCLVYFCQGVVASHDWCTKGNRSSEDLDRVRFSTEHHWDLTPGQVCWTTSFVGGRAKLHGRKRGTRQWKNWRICMCPNGVHHSPGEELLIGKDGNPFGPLDEKYCTTCPVFAGELLASLQPDNDFRIWKKWSFYSGGFGKQNNADVILIARNFYHNQGVMSWETPFDRHSGRKALALWCSQLNIRYREGIHVYGDLQCIWRDHYQPNLKQSDYEGREQALDYQCATAALRRFRTFLGRDPPPAPMPANVSVTDQALLVLSQSVGAYDRVRAVYES